MKPFTLAGATVIALATAANAAPPEAPATAPAACDATGGAACPAARPGNPIPGVGIVVKKEPSSTDHAITEQGLPGTKTGVKKDPK